MIWRKVMGWLAVGAVSALLVVGAGFYRSSISETGMFNLSLPQKAKVAGGSRPVVVDVQEQGLLKRVLQPWVIQVSTHGLENKSSKSYTLQFELTDGKVLPVVWDVRDPAWDPERRVLDRPFQPGQRIPVRILFKVPEELRNQAVIYQGHLQVRDYQTQEQLASVPITIANSRVKKSPAVNNCSENGSRDCCSQ